jgi:SanA protein
VSGRIKRATWILAGLVLSAAIAVILCHGLVARAASGRCFDQPDHLPAHEVALVLGCSRNTAHGWSNPFFEHRIHAAASLYRSGKVRYFIVSGDNSRPGYDEPSDMKQALVERGVPADRIYRDFAGLRTLDSVVRAREIFGVTEVVIVSQRFHVERALYLASAYGIDATGYCAGDIGGGHGLKAQIREAFARVKAVLDVHVLRTRPRFGGPKVPVGEGEAN